MQMVEKPNLYSSLDMILEIDTKVSKQWSKRRSKWSPTSYISKKMVQKGQKQSKTIERG